jgi:hypothetical protein
LRDERNVAWRGWDARGAGVETEFRYDESDAVGTQHAQHVRSCRGKRRFARVEVEVGGKDNGRAGSERPEIVNRAWDAVRRSTNQREIRHLRQIHGPPVRAQAANRRLARIQREDRSLKSGKEVLH